MDITAHQLRCFVAAADALHFRQAADSLHISPSTLSENIASLERRVKAPLFDRAPRRVSLTTAGRELVVLARAALTAMDDVSTWARTERESSPRIRVGLMVSSPRFRAVMATATRAMPRVRWEINQLGLGGGLDNGGLEGSAAGVDCAFVVEPGDVTPPRRSTPLWSEGCVLVVSTGHRLARRKSVHIRDIAHETFISVKDAATSNRWLSTLIGRSDGIVQSPSAHTFEEILELCAAGLGVNIAGASAAYGYTRGDLAFIPVLGVPDLTTYFVTPHGADGVIGEFARIVELTAASPDF